VHRAPSLRKVIFLSMEIGYKRRFYTHHHHELGGEHNIKDKPWRLYDNRPLMAWLPADSTRLDARPSRRTESTDIRISYDTSRDVVVGRWAQTFIWPSHTTSSVLRNNMVPLAESYSVLQLAHLVPGAAWWYM
jgi:hypothetical protein